MATGNWDAPSPGLLLVATGFPLIPLILLLFRITLETTALILWCINVQTSANLLFSRLNGGRTKTAAVHSVEWQDDTGNFYTSSTDVHHNNGIDNTHMALPFCVRSCHKNSLVATGDEEGSIRLLDSDPAVGKGFRKAYLFMKPHSNAVMDMTFSENDDYLATACGDQTSQIIDVRRQESIHTLRGHVSTLKSVLFQPGSGSKVVVSGARDGNINIYDLRCPASTVPAANLHTGKSFQVDGTRTLA